MHFQEGVGHRNRSVFFSGGLSNFAAENPGKNQDRYQQRFN